MTHLLKKGIASLKEEGLRKTLPKVHRKYATWRRRRQITGKRLFAQARSEADKNVVKILFELDGGIGDYIVAANYIYHFHQKFCRAPIDIDVLLDGNSNAGSALFQNDSFINHYYCDDLPKNCGGYDLYIEIIRYPDILHKDAQKLKRLVPELAGYILICENFKSQFPHFFQEKVMMAPQYTQFEIMKGRTRVQQPDISGYLGIPPAFDVPIHVDDHEYAFLKGMDLTSKTYITLHRGCDLKHSAQSTKLWPTEYYSVLAAEIKRHYPQYTLVQLGASRDRCQDIDGTDMNLVGETSLEEVKVLLKHSKLHIDCEGGMVHLRSALHGGPSIVLFGPTSPEYFGYIENRNLRGGGCKHWCEWLSRDWMEHCLLGQDNPSCMQSITPERVMKEVRSVLGEE